ncbi:signal peptide peptidase SppA [Halomonas sp. DP5N14-9]|uniref:signal peptide peptidase SppA n=1 Tax=Halomonas sp. DP5N14-9 TaxID=2859075 RepID=UPI001C98F0F5|nr:signal peptide peptidase SppA [Halomonas sp. DP5N14-9]MBY5940559.1 signal peptide peptidase SppA [Halomonas sp. DP5N14-9]
MSQTNNRIGGNQEAGPDEALRLQQWQTFDKWMESTITERRRSRRWKIFFRFLFIIFLFASLANTVYFLHFAVPGKEELVERHLGIVDVKGVIDADEEATASRINEGLRRALNADQIAAVVLRINSPGGSPVQSQRVYEEIRFLEEEHPDTPILAWVEDMGASGAYYIASAAQYIYAAPSSLVGSIGVISSGFGFRDAIDKLGVERRVFTSGENKAFLDPFTPVTEHQRNFWESVLSSTHEQFIADVKAGRGDRLQGGDDIFSGLIWTGEQAKGLGLIDEVLTLEQLSRELIGSVELRNYTPRLSTLDRLTKGFGPMVQSLLGMASYRNAEVRYEMP